MSASSSDTNTLTPLLPTTGSHQPLSDFNVAGATGAVLLVEDQPDIARMLTRVFLQAGLRVIAAANPREGLLLIEHNSSDIALAFVDCHTPGAENFEFCRDARRIVPALPVVLAGGHALASSAAGSSYGGVTLFVARPYLPTELVWTVRAMLAKAA